jgi:hypothetical protein
MEKRGNRACIENTTLKQIYQSINLTARNRSFPYIFYTKGKKGQHVGAGVAAALSIGVVVGGSFMEWPAPPVIFGLQAPGGAGLPQYS